MNNIKQASINTQGIRKETKPGPATSRSRLLVLTHPFWGLLIFLAILGITLFCTYQIALPASNWLYTTLVRSTAAVVERLLASQPDWLRVIIVEGIIGGIGTVLSFVPILLIFFTVLGLLEKSNYLAYSSRITDRYLHWIGLPGTACIPLSLGFGCNTSAVLGCRVLKERRSRLLTMLLVPYVPCTSRLAVIALLTPAFFGEDAVWVTWGLISFNLIVLAGVGFLVNKVKPQRVQQPADSDLPPIRWPDARSLVHSILSNIAEFLTKMRMLVLVSTLIWALSYFPGGELESSYLARFGQAVLPLGKLAGLNDWRFIVAMLASFASKENVIAVLGVLFPLHASGQPLSGQITQVLEPAARLSFLAMQMLFIPCVSTLAAIRAESASRKFVVLQTGLMLGISITAGILIYQVTRGW